VLPSGKGINCSKGTGSAWRTNSFAACGWRDQARRGGYRCRRSQCQLSDVGCPAAPGRFPPIRVRREEDGTRSPMACKTARISALSTGRRSSPAPHLCGVLVGTKPVNSCAAQRFVTFGERARVFFRVDGGDQAEFFGEVIRQGRSLYSILPSKPDSGAVIALESEARP